ADLSPGSPDLPAVLDTIAGLGEMLTPSPDDAVPVIDNIRPLLSKGRHLLDKPAGVLSDRDVYVAALERFDPGMVRGDTLLHYDLSAGNLLVGHGRVWLLDWSFAARGAAWVDAAMFAPRLVEAGHAPDAVDGMLERVPSWRTAPRDTLVGLAALWTMFRLYKSLYGPEEVREARARAAVAGRAWLDHLTACPDPAIERPRLVTSRGRSPLYGSLLGGLLQRHPRPVPVVHVRARPVPVGVDLLGEIP